MSDASSTPETGSQVVSEPNDDALPPPPAVLLHPRPPRAGDLALGWRAVTAATWIGVIVGFAAVWNASVQLGLSTWWLGPRADPQPRVIQFSPFIAPVLMLLATINQARWLGWAGLVAAAAVAGVAIGDIGRVNGLAVVELAIAGAAAAVSIASLTGTYRAIGSPAASATSQPPADEPTTR